MANWWEVGLLDPFGTLAPSGLAGLHPRAGLMHGQTPALRTDGKIVPGGPAGKIGPPQPPQPLSTNWWLNTAVDFTPVGAAMALGEAAHAIGSLPRNATWGEWLPALGAGALAAIGAVPGGRGVTKAGGLAMDEASRMARADAMGFYRGMPILIGTAPEGERVAAAAIKGADGTIYQAPAHFMARDDMATRLGREVTNADFARDWDGFVTTSGRYIDRREAEFLARQGGQDAGKGANPYRAARGMVSEELKPAGVVPQTNVSTGATAPGLPGIEGVWGVRQSSPPPGQTTAGLGIGATSMPGTGTAQAWFRSSKPGPLDAEGLSDVDLQATIRQAWNDGYDALIARNYTRPGGKTRERVVVVKDQNQLRTPDAAFDPAKKLSRDLTAAIGVPALTFGMLMPQMEERY